MENKQVLKRKKIFDEMFPSANWDEMKIVSFTILETRLSRHFASILIPHLEPIIENGN